jgi:hypothetical protein
MFTQLHHDLALPVNTSITRHRKVLSIHSPLACREKSPKKVSASTQFAQIIYTEMHASGGESGCVERE